MLCSKCNREPEPFETEFGTGYWFIVDKEECSPIYLMSDMSLKFRCTPDLEPNLDKDEAVLCVECVTEMNEEQ